MSSEIFWNYVVPYIVISVVIMWIGASVDTWGRYGIRILTVGVFWPIFLVVGIVVITFVLLGKMLWTLGLLLVLFTNAIIKS